MYFLRIEKLKTQSAEHPLSDREILPYFVASALLGSLLYFSQTRDRSQAGGLFLGYVILIFITIFGIAYVYQMNGGKNGRHFLQRYIALGWIVACRWSLFSFILSIITAAIKLATGLDAMKFHWFDLASETLIALIIVLRTGHHVRDVARRSN